MQLTQLAAAHPEQVHEDDVELQALEAREEEERVRAMDQPLPSTVAAAGCTEATLHVEPLADSTTTVAPQLAGDTQTTAAAADDATGSGAEAGSQARPIDTSKQVEGQACTQA